MFPDRRLACELESESARYSVPDCSPDPRLRGKRKRSSSVAALTARSISPRFEAVNQGTTFCQQAERWMNHIRTRKRNSISAATEAGYRSYLNKWLNTNLGDPPISAVDNKAGKALVAKLHAANLAPKTIVEIVGVMKEVVASAIDSDGRRMFPGEWNHEYMDVPIVDPQKQHRPTLTPAQVGSHQTSGQALSRSLCSGRNWSSNR